MLVVKTVLVIGIQRSISAEEFAEVQSTLNYIGYFCEYTPSLDFGLVSTLAPDIIGVGATIFGLVYSYRYNPSMIKNSRTVSQ